MSMIPVGADFPLINALEPCGYAMLSLSMATRSSSARSSRVRSSSLSSGHDLRDAVSYHASAIIVLFVFTILTSFGLSLWMLKMYVGQDQLRSALDLVAGKVLSVEEQTAAGVGPALLPHVFVSSSVQGVFVSDTLCPPGELGQCGDSMVAKETEGGYVVVVKSVRSLMNSLGYDALARPVAISADGQTLAFRLGGATDPKELQEHIVLFDTVQRRVKDVDVAIPVSRVLFSPRLEHVAYFVAKNGEARELVVVNVMTGVKKTVARAAAGETYQPSDTAFPAPTSMDDSSVLFNVYISSDATHLSPELKGVQTAEFSF
jgi:hypothetical protein